jgi:hypothetical protein
LKTLPFFEIARVLARHNHVASRIVNANQSIMRSAAVHRVADCVIRLGVPQPTEWQRIGNQIDATMVFRGRTS